MIFTRAHESMMRLMEPELGILKDKKQGIIQANDKIVFHMEMGSFISEIMKPIREGFI